MQAQERVGKTTTEKIRAAIDSLRSGNSSFEHAYDTYIQQYGIDAILVNEPLSLSGTIDSVVLAFGQTRFIRFKDQTKELTGTLGTFSLASEGAYIIGRRQPQDSKLIVWNPRDNSETELEEYDARSSYIPSRIHGAFISSAEGVSFTDLSSSAGTIIFGELKEGGPFVTLYDPGSENFPRFKVNRIQTFRKS
jgi:hypothetical protein